MPPEDEEHGGGEHGDGGGGDESGGGRNGADGGRRPDSGELRQAIREVLAEMGVRPGGDNGSDQGGGGGDDRGQERPGGAYAAEEARWESLVRRELERVKAAEDLTNLREEVRKIVERPPKQYRRVTRALWGPTDDD